MKIAFFGTPTFAVTILDELKKAGIVPSLVVTAPDKPQGRKLVITPPPVKVWALENNIRTIQPETLKGPAASSLFFSEDFDLFIVAAYGKILPQEILDIPKHGTLNVHPSLLPLHRGPSPIEAQILAGDEVVGVTIMLLDDQMDHGPIIAQEALPMPEPLPRGGELEDLLARKGGAILAETIPAWLRGSIDPQEQDHDQATYTKKIKKEDGLLDLDPDAAGRITSDPAMHFRKIRAYDPWPGTYFFVEKNNKKRRVLVKDATFENGKLTITRVLPEGGKEMPYQDFQHSIHPGNLN